MVRKMNKQKHVLLNLMNRMSQKRPPDWFRMLPNPCCVSHPGSSYGPLRVVPCRRGPGQYVPWNLK